jgi:hypothetical protein
MAIRCGISVWPDGWSAAKVRRLRRLTAHERPSEGFLNLGNSGTGVSQGGMGVPCFEQMQLLQRYALMARAQDAATTTDKRSESRLGSLEASFPTRERWFVLSVESTSS